MQTMKSSTCLWAVLLCFFSFQLGAQDSPAAIKTEAALPAGPITSLEFGETDFDFGVIESGDIVTHVFTFSNTGNEALIISNAQGSCGCTVPKWPLEPIMPGETASLTVKFDSKSKSGNQSKRVTITSNTDPVISLLTIHGKVELAKDNSDAIDVELAEDVAPTIDKDCFAIFPNPTAEVVKLDMDESNFGKSAIISIHSKEGQLMARREIESIDGITEFMVDHYPSGTYFASIQIGKKAPETRCFVVVD